MIMSEIEDQTLTTEEALLIMPLLTKSALVRLRRQGKGPKFGVFSNKVVYQRADVEKWYNEYKTKSFTQTKVAPRVRQTTAAPRAVKTVAKKANGGGKDLLG
jgi:hypothetical protein